MNTSSNDVITYSNSDFFLELTEGNIYQVRIDYVNFYVTYNVIFPSDAQLEVVDGYLVNLSSSPVTGLLYDGAVDLSSFHQYFLTLNSITSTNSNSSAYQYGSYAYVTRYFVNNNYGLSSERTYCQVQVIDEPKLGYDWDTFSITLIGLIFILFLCEIMGGLLRR